MITFIDLNDFSNLSRYLTFYSYHSVNCQSTYITIFNDNINEADEQLFVILLSLVSSNDPSLVRLTRNVSKGIIVDDDRKLPK